MKIFPENEEIEVFGKTNLFQMKHKIKTIILGVIHKGRPANTVGRVEEMRTSIVIC